MTMLGSPKHFIVMGYSPEKDQFVNGDVKGSRAHNNHIPRPLFMLPAARKIALEKTTNLVSSQITGSSLRKAHSP